MALLEAAEKGGGASPESIRLLRADLEAAKAERDAGKKPSVRLQSATEKVEKKQAAYQALADKIREAEEALAALREEA